MYKIVYTNRMKKDAKLMKKRGKDMGKLVNTLLLLTSGNPMPIFGCGNWQSYAIPFVLFLQNERK